MVDWLLSCFIGGLSVRVLRGPRAHVLVAPVPAFTDET